MVILILEKAPVSLRGELSRFMIEPRTGVFVGRVSAMVRDKLWDLTMARLKGGGAVMVHSSPNEQGFRVRTFGATKREVVDFGGVSLVRIPPAPPARPKSGARGQADA